MVHELNDQCWAKKMNDLLVAANRGVADGLPTAERKEQINADYTAIPDQGNRVHPIKKRKDDTPHRIGVNGLRSICCDDCANIVEMSCPSSRIQRRPLPITSLNRRFGFPRLNIRYLAVSESLMEQPLSARSNPIWQPYASRASISASCVGSVCSGGNQQPTVGYLHPVE